MMTRLNDLFALARGEIDDIPVAQPLAYNERRVEPSGPLDALIAVVGEAPGYEEAEKGFPFVGKSGKKIRYWAKQAGVDLATCYLDNVYPFYPPAGKITNIPAEEIATATVALWARLSRLPQLRVIVPTGNIALKALLDKDGITKHRGSIYPITIAGRQVKAIPLIHPAAVLRGQAIWERRCHLDWQRIAAEAKTEEVQLPVRRHITNPTPEQIHRFIQGLRSPLAIDIETKPSEGRILCVGFSYEASEGLVLAWNQENMAAICALCENPVNKALWNHLYDKWWLTREGIQVNGRIRDGMHALHALMPTDNVGLAYTTSIHTREEYYKDDKKDEDDRTAEENWERFKEYNSKDACVTRELDPIIFGMLDKEGMTDFYITHYEELAEPMLDLMLEGVRIDHARRKVVLEELLTEARAARDNLMFYNDDQPLFTLSTKRDKAVWAALFEDGLEHADRLPYTSEQINKSLDTIAAKTVSREKLKDLVYNKFGLPIQFKKRDTGEETETLDIFTLQQFRFDPETPDDVRPVLDLAIEHTETHKLATFIYDSKFDEDGRMRFSLKCTTEQGRLASSASPRGRKVNSQNIPRDERVRTLIIPEESHVCMQVDGSAAEARVCFVRTKDKELITLARDRFHDQHRQTGVIVGFTGTFEETPENLERISKQQRQISKSISHGSQRAMQGSRLSQTLLKGWKKAWGPFTFDDAYCDVAIDRYHKRFPAIRRWQEQVRKQIWKDRVLVNSWGRRWPVPYYNLDDELWRRGLSFLLQSEVADVLNMWGFKAVWYWLRKHKMRSRVMLQEHDGLVLSCAVDEVYDVAVFLRDSLEQEREYDGVGLSIPVETALGPNWGTKTQEWKVLPSREEFESVARHIVEEEKEI